MSSNFTFDLFDPDQRLLVRTMLDALDHDSKTPSIASPAPPPRAVTDQINRKLPKILRLGSGELLVLAVQNFGPDVQWDVKQLADKTGKDVATILSKNRTLAHSCKKRGIQKSSLLTEHGGSPRRFSIPAAVHAEITRILNEQQPAASDTIATK